jgi:mRNA-degrading endonuclease HigB of HigAB toxin-antitoxin module
MPSRRGFGSGADLKQSFGAASIVSADRGLQHQEKGCRLVAAIDYARHILFIKWIEHRRITTGLT